MAFKKLVSTMLLGGVLTTSLCLTPISIVSANETEQSISEEQYGDPDKRQEQLNSLIDETAKLTGLDSVYVRILIALAGGQPLYSDIDSDVYKDETIKELDEPMRITGAVTSYRKAPSVRGINNDKFERDSKYYMPDALYSVASDIANLMSQRKFVVRKQNSLYFDTLTDKTKNNILFYEAVLKYTGSSDKEVNRLFNAYMQIVQSKDRNKNVVVQSSSTGKSVIKKKYRKIFKKNKIESTNALDLLAIMLSFDGNMASSDDTSNITTSDIELPYIRNYTSRENMMIAAISLVGKVRYVWGGGHQGTAKINGINPMWQVFNDMYSKTPGGNGYGRSLRPSRPWCPIHNGEQSSEFHGRTVYSLSDYLGIRDNYLTDSELNTAKKVLSTIQFNRGINEHLVDGLDCSGYASWIYNQVTDDYQFDSAARYFSGQYGNTKVNFGDKLLPGDTFAWMTHITNIVGPARQGSRAYVIAEQVPNVLKFGVAYYSDATASDIELAKRIANEANELIGNIDTNTEKLGVYCMNNTGKYEVAVKKNVKKYKKIKVTRLVKEKLSKKEIKALKASKVKPIKIKEKELNSKDFKGKEGKIYKDEKGRYYTFKKKNVKVKKAYKVKEKVIEQRVYHTIGRFSRSFNDEDKVIDKYGTSFENLDAKQIIQHTLSKLPLSYVNGYSVYKGDLFNKEEVATDIGIHLE